MRCDDFLPLIEKLADGEAEAAERHQAEAHLESCTSCQAHLRFLRALPKAARQTSLPAPPEMYWDVLPRKIMSRIAKETAEGRGGWFGRLLTPSRLRWAGAMAAALVAAVVGLRVVEFPLGDRSRPSSSATRSNEEKREAAISSHDAPASPALPGPDDTEQEAVAGEPAALSADSLTAVRRQVSEEPVDDAAQEEALKDESFERPAGKRVAGEPVPPPAPDVAGEQFATGALAGAGKARQEKQDDSAEALDRRVAVGQGGREGRGPSC